MTGAQDAATVVYSDVGPGTKRAEGKGLAEARE